MRLLSSGINLLIWHYIILIITDLFEQRYDNKRLPRKLISSLIGQHIKTLTVKNVHILTKCVYAD